MRKQQVAELSQEFVSRTFLPPKRPPRIAKSYVVVGFDVEWDSKNRKFLSCQLAAHDVNGIRHSIVQYPRVPRLTDTVLAENVKQFLGGIGRVPAVVRGRRDVVLVAHFAAAELSMFEDALRDVKITQIGKAHHAELPVLTDDDDNSKWRLRLVDLYSYFKTSLKSVGASVGVEKLDVDRADLASLLACDRALFEVYAARDAEIALEGFVVLRKVILDDWGVDIIFCPTLASVASTVFRHRFLRSAPAPYSTEKRMRNRQSSSGWRGQEYAAHTYSGPLERRILALQSYWGGRVEAYRRGLVVEQVRELDVVSLYPHATLLQPLPNARTKWFRVTSIEDVAVLEGFGRFSFKFPPGCMYPCLPVMSETVERLVFPLQGQTCCTFAEVRQALKFDATVRIKEAFGFRPGQVERNHDVGRYMREFLDRKKQYVKGSLDYEVAKLMLNSLVGKFAERRRGSRLLEIERTLRGLEATGIPEGRIPRSLIRSHRATASPGGLWVPEWAALILGRARAIMADIVSQGALLVSTDSVIVPARVAIACDSLDDLRRIGSDLKEEVRGDGVFIARSRLYAILAKVGSFRRSGFASDDSWSVVRVARHGAQESEDEFAETVLACLRARGDVAPERTRKRLLSAEAAVREGGAINAEVERSGRTHFRWDSKRRLVNRGINLFTGSSTTVPYLTVRKLEGAERQKRVRDGVVRRKRRRFSNAKLAHVEGLLRAGVGVRKVSRDTGVPRSTVSDIKKRIGVV